MVNLNFSIDASFYFNVTNNMTVYAHINSLSLTCPGYWNNSGKVSFLKFSTFQVEVSVGGGAVISIKFN